MILEKNKIIFKTVSILLEDNRILPLLRSGEYSSIIALSYNDLPLPGFVKTSKPTLLIDLKRKEEDIIAGFNDTTRNEIRKTYKDKEFKITTKDTPDAESYSLYSSFEFSQGRVPVSINDLKDCVYFGIKYNNELISGIYVNKSKPYLRIRSIFSKRLIIEDKEMYKIIGYATRRLIWEACLYGKKEGYISLDMASVNINNPKTLSISKFKMSFGKELVPEYTYTYKTRTFRNLERIAQLKNILKRIFHKVKSIFV